MIGDKTININDYVSPTGLMDIAIAMGDEYHYNMSGEFDAKINKSIADIDWQSMVSSSAFADFDVEAAAENPESLVGFSRIYSRWQLSDADEPCYRRS